MKQQPLVSVIIPTYSRPDNIVRAIESVLAQTYKNIEIIVVDDNGEGTPCQIETESVLNDYISQKKIIYIKHNVNKNGSAARNTGVRNSEGTLIALMDDDDYFMPSKIEAQVKRLLNLHSVDSTYKSVYCNTVWKVPHGDKYLMSSLEGALAEEILIEKVSFNSSTILIFKEAYIELGGFDESFMRHQDWEFLMRYFRKYKIGVTEPNTQLLIKYMGPNALSKNPYKAISYCEKFLEAFRDDISKLPNAEIVYHVRYMELGKTLIRSGFFKDGLKYISKSNSYKRNSMKDNFLIFRCMLGYFVKKTGLWK